jgi:hypothetical protein
MNLNLTEIELKQINAAIDSHDNLFVYSSKMWYGFKHKLTIKC